MTIEVRQLQIKSNVLPEGNPPANSGSGGCQAAEVEDRVLKECRRLILQILQAERER